MVKKLLLLGRLFSIKFHLQKFIWLIGDSGYFYHTFLRMVDENKVLILTKDGEETRDKKDCYLLTLRSQELKTV